MAEASIRARIAADASGFHEALRNTEDAAKAWGIRMARTTAGAGAGMGKGMGGSMALLEFSRAAEDAQYGIRGVLNNIPGLAMALGGGAGLAGAASLAAVAIATLGKRTYDFVTNAKGIKEATDEMGRLDEKLKAAQARNAKQSLEGTAEGAQKLKGALAEANAEFADGNAKLAASVALSKQAADATHDLERARIAASDIPEAEKILLQLELEKKATIEAMEAERARLEQSIRLHQQRFDAARRARDVAQADMEEAGPVTREAKTRDLEKAQAALDEIDNTREQTTLTNQLLQLEGTGKKRLEAMEIEANAKADAAREKAREDRNKAFDEMEEGFDKEEDAYQKKLALMEKERRKQQQINAEHKEALGDLRAEGRIKGLREQGRDTQADREERALRVQQRTRQIMGLGETNPAAAVSLATQLEGGSGRINARSRRHRQAGGIDEITEAPSKGSSSELRAIRSYLKDIKDNTDGQGKNKSAPVNKIE